MFQPLPINREPIERYRKMQSSVVPEREKYMAPPQVNAESVPIAPKEVSDSHRMWAEYNKHTDFFAVQAVKEAGWNVGFMKSVIGDLLK